MTVLVCLAVVAACGGSTDPQAGTPATAAATSVETSGSGICGPRNIPLATSADGTPIAPTVPGADAALAATIADSFCSPTWTQAGSGSATETFTTRPQLPPDEAVCIGEGLVEALSPARVRELAGLGTGPWHLLSFGLFNNQGERQVARAEAEAIVDTFVSCSTSWKLLLVLSVTEGADEISDDSARCASDHLTDEEARITLVGEIDRAYADPSQSDAQPFAELIAPLIAAFDECLSADERANIDFS